MRRRTAVLSASAALAMTMLIGACASEPEPDPAQQSVSASESAAVITPAVDDDALGVTVTGEVNPTIKPTVEIATPLTVTETTRTIVAEGTGDEVTADDEVQFAYSLYAGSTGAELDSSYGGTDARFQLGEVTKGIAAGLVGTHVGDRVAIAISPDDGFGEAAANFEQEGVDETTTFVLVADVVRIIATMAEGAAVTPPADLPTVTTDDDGVPTAINPNGYAAPTDLVVQPLITGTGPVVTTGQNISVQYLGVTLSDGEIFDQSWTSGTPFPTAIGTGAVIPGWDNGIVGQTVGSRVLLVIPADQAYGDAPTSGQPAGALVFVVDILDAY